MPCRRAAADDRAERRAAWAEQPPRRLRRSTPAQLAAQFALDTGVHRPHRPRGAQTRGNGAGRRRGPGSRAGRSASSPQASWAGPRARGRAAHLLHAIADQVRNRWQVYHEWALGERAGRGLGIAALFTGPSGTGKTLAAEVLAHDLDLDLYKADLSGIVSKYIGETEKNLRRLFDAAEAGGGVLFIDEADALLGKRSEVQGQPRPVRQHPDRLPAAADGDLPRAGDPRHEHAVGASTARSCAGSGSSWSSPSRSPQRAAIWRAHLARGGAGGGGRWTSTGWRSSRSTAA